MRVVTSSGGSIVNTLDRARRELALLAAASEVEIQSLTRGFEDLAGQASAILTLASAIIETIESDGVRSVLPSVQSLGSAARHFVEDRLHSTTGILDTVNTEVNLLRHLSRVADSQATIALKTRVLTMLTNVEVGRLGPEGSGFQYLATELSKFSNALSDDTEELADQTDTRRTAIEATRRVLSAEIPQLRAEFTRIDVHMEEQLASLESGLTRLSGIPLQFKSCVEEIAGARGGIAGAGSCARRGEYPDLPAPEHPRLHHQLDHPDPELRGRHPQCERDRTCRDQPVGARAGTTGLHQASSHRAAGE
jgi:hypothetical protein